MSIVDKLIPDDVKPILDQVFADKELSRDLNTVISAAAPLLEAAGKNSATDQSLKGIFNDVASVVPYAQKCLEKGKVIVFGAPIGTFMRLDKNKNVLKKAFDDQGPEVNVILNSLLNNNDVQAALGRSLTKPVGQDLFRLEKDQKGQGYAIEQISGIKIPLPEANYNKIKALVDAAASKKPPTQPQGPSV